MAGRLEALFSRCDIRGRGWIEIEEFKQICTDMGISMVQHSTVQFMGIFEVMIVFFFMHVLYVVVAYTIDII